MAPWASLQTTVNATLGRLMPKNSIPRTNPDHLRRMAEERLGNLAKTESSDPTEMKRLLHELQVHQIELEMQNDELQQARDSISALVNTLAP